MKDMHIAEFDTDDIRTEEQKAVFVNSKKTTTAALWKPFAQKLYLAVREKYFLGNITGRLKAVLDAQ